MSFADELRKAPQAKEQEERQRYQNMWDEFCAAIYNEIKGRAKENAVRGSNYVTSKVSNILHNFQDEYTVPDDLKSKVLNDLKEEDCQLLEEYLEFKLKLDGLDRVKFKRIAVKKYRKEQEYVAYEGAEKLALSLLSLLNSGEDTEGHYVTKKVLDSIRYDLEINVTW